MITRTEAATLTASAIVTIRTVVDGTTTDPWIDAVMSDILFLRNDITIGTARIGTIAESDTIGTVETAIATPTTEDTTMSIPTDTTMSILSDTMMIGTTTSTMTKTVITVTGVRTTGVRTLRTIVAATRAATNASATVAATIARVWIRGGNGVAVAASRSIKRKRSAKSTTTRKSRTASGIGAKQPKLLRSTNSARQRAALFFVSVERGYHNMYSVSFISASYFHSQYHQYEESCTHSQSQS